LPINLHIDAEKREKKWILEKKNWKGKKRRDKHILILSRWGESWGAARGTPVRTYKVARNIPQFGGHYPDDMRDGKPPDEDRRGRGIYHLGYNNRIEKKRGKRGVLIKPLSLSSS